MIKEIDNLRGIPIKDMVHRVFSKEAYDFVKENKDVILFKKSLSAFSYRLRTIRNKIGKMKDKGETSIYYRKLEKELRKRYIELRQICKERKSIYMESISYASSIHLNYNNHYQIFTYGGILYGCY